jgi:ABC-type sugar transport system substrate-binding protein
MTGGIRSRKKLLAGFASAAIVLAACSSSGATTAPSVAPSAVAASAIPGATTVPGLKANKPYRIAVLFPNAGDPYFQQKRYGYEDEAKKTGVELTFFDAGGYANIDKQIAQIEDATQQKFDAIAIAVTSSTATVPSLEAAVKQGILVVGDGVFPESDKVIKRGEDSEMAGYNAGKYLGNALKDGGSVGLLLGPPGIDLIHLREVGVKKGLAEFPKATIAQGLNNLSDLVSSTKAAEDILQAHPDVKGFYAFNSVVAQAIVSALKSAGKKAGDVTVATVDMDPDLEQAIKDGWVQETNVAGSVLLGRVVVDTIVQKLNGQDVPAEGYLKPNEITKDNLNSFDRTILYPPQ